MAIEQAQPESGLRGPRRRRPDFGALLWLCGWGTATAIALTALAITSQTKSASERLRLIFAVNEPTAVAQIPPRVAQLESETQQLATQLRALTSDRDRLVGRVALLENSIDDMTGAIKRQATVTAAALAAKTTPPVPAAPATTPAVSSGPPVNSSAPPAPASVPTANSAPKVESSTSDATPLPPTRIATAPPTEAEQPAATQNEFGLDLGGATTIDGVRQRWTTVKANFGPMLNGMRPVAAREHRQGATGYRLVVGPLPNSIAAASLCAQFTAARTQCRAAKFEGEQIVQR